MTTFNVTSFSVGLIPTELSSWFGLPVGHAYAGRSESLPIQFHLITLPGRLVLVDAPAYEFPGDDSMLLPEYKGLDAARLLAAQGIAAEAVTDVVFTHPHLDHTLGISRPVQSPTQVVFPRARHYLSAKDWNSDKLEDVERQPFGVVQQAGLLTLVEGELDLGDGLTIVPTPGETPGHQMVWLKDGTRNAYIVGDLFHHVLEFEEPGRHPVWADGPTLQASKSMLAARAAESAARVYFTHIVGAWGVERSGQTWHWNKV